MAAHSFCGKDIQAGFQALPRGCLDVALRAGSPAHPSGTAAGVGDRERLDRLSAAYSQGPMRALIVLRIRTWLLADMERLWSQWAPRRAAGEIAAVAMDGAREPSGPGAPQLPGEPIDRHAPTRWPVLT